MIVKQYIKDFENLGFGMFVHFGLYSMIGLGEWGKKLWNIPDDEYYELFNKFDPKPDWAEKLVSMAKGAGCKYITLTTRHHDGFSLFDTCGLNDYDSMHAKCGRDLVREFVDACRKENIIPFFYHTLLDWHEKSYYTDFKSYLCYLRKSVEILCTNYGKIGGIWFDGMWDKRDEDWEEDELYATIRRHQPDAMIINNTGLSRRGKLGHIELDSVTFERGKPEKINIEDSAKYVASEMCEVTGRNWGYAKDNITYKSPNLLIEELAFCRRYKANFLLNIGPMGDGSITNMDAAIFEIIEKWMHYNKEAIGEPKPCGIEIEDNERDFILKKDDKTYYMFCYDLPMAADTNVDRFSDVEYLRKFKFDSVIESVEWLDDKAPLSFEQKDGYAYIQTVPYKYGRNLIVRVAKITTK